MNYRMLLRLMMFSLLLTQVGCVALLPRAKAVSESPWQEYSDAKGSFDSIKIGETTVEDLKQLGFDVNSSPNLKIMNYLDIAATVQAIPIDQLDPGLQACLVARAECRAYIFEPRRIYTTRVGNFWLDITNFRRQSHETGWRFRALIVFVNHHVAYKLSSGEPQVDQFEDKINPLGPFQTPADSIARAFSF